MDIVAKDLLLYLIDEHDCINCKFIDMCKELQNKGERCLCDIAYQELIKR